MRTLVLSGKDAMKDKLTESIRESYDQLAISMQLDCSTNFIISRSTGNFSIASPLKW